MGTCIICGTPVDGKICSSHEEDAAFHFHGSHANQLVRNRYYSGTVDGYADFGVFVDLAPNVTGLLHRSELDRRLESLDWEPGDTVYVQVKNVRDNGNIDLGWSIRQSEREFRGVLVQDGNDEYSVEEYEEQEDERDEQQSAATQSKTDGAGTSDEARNDTGSRDAQNDRSEESEPEGHDREAEPTDEVERAEITTLGDRVGDVLRVEGEIVSVRQTGGPTVFEVRDETGVVNCAAFVEAGVRAYPEVEVGDVVRLDGEVELRRDELQIETEALGVLDGDDAETVRGRLADALTERARPSGVMPLAGHDSVAAISESLLDAAEAVRRAVLESRPIVVRHAATADGYVAGAAVERAVLPLVREEYAKNDAVYHYFKRRPLDDVVYGMDAATNDVSRMLQDRDRHDEKLPLVLLLGTGSTVDSEDGLDLLGIYGASRVVVDAAVADAAVGDHCDVLVNPALEGEDVTDLSTGALAANLAAAINDEVRDDLAHLPAVSYWENTPEAYVDIATDAGYDEERVTELREAVALEAYYQSYQDKRELITDLLFGEPGSSVGDRENGLATHISKQFRTKLDDEVRTAEANLEERDENGVSCAVIDTDAFTHRFDFPPTALLLDELHRQNREGDRFVTVGVALDELYIRSTDPVDVRAAAEAARETEPEAGITAVGVRENRIEFLSGARDDVTDAVLEAIVEQFE